MDVRTVSQLAPGRTAACQFTVEVEFTSTVKEPFGLPGDELGDHLELSAGWSQRHGGIRGDQQRQRNRGGARGGIDEKRALVITGRDAAGVDGYRNCRGGTGRRWKRALLPTLTN